MNQQLSWRTIVGYSLGDVANNFAFAMGALFLLSYYTDVAGVGAAAAGTMLLLVRVFDAFADVFAGRVVDSVNTRWGKFRPFLLFGTAPLMIFSVLVFWVPTDWSHGSKVVYAYLTYMGLGLCYSLVNIPYGSLATAMTQQPQSRARLGAARGIAASLTFVCLAFLIGPSIKNSSPEEMVSVYHFWTIVLAIAGMVLYFICFKSTRENVVRIVAQPSFTVEYGEYLTGVRIEGLTYSLFSFTRKCGQAIGGSIPAFILGLSGYIANQVQTPEVIMGIRTSIALVPCGFMLLAFVIIWFYPLTDKKFKEIVVEIDNRKKVQQQLISDITN
ncbi:TPA: glycoside-pentoside-hexuronide (GPH):cation symporter [Escherichia coli]